MVASEARDYLEHGTVRNSVNFPELEMPRTEGCRYLVVNSNVPHMLESITGAIASADLNIVDLLNKSRGDIACTLLDIECVAPETVLDRMRAVEGVKAVYAL
jgi:D-3-phosphoglycerate dehydrogenase